MIFYELIRNSLLEDSARIKAPSELMRILFELYSRLNAKNKDFGYPESSEDTLKEYGSLK